MGKGIEINVEIYSDAELELIGLDVEINESENLLERRTFWKIDYAMPNRKKPQESIFCVAGDIFLTPMSYEDFVKLVNKPYS